MSHGYIYVFREPLNDNLIKVGFSKNPFNRRMQLFRTGNPLPLNIYQIWWVSNMRAAEGVAHERLASHRVNERREFFEIAPTSQHFEWEYQSYDVTTVYLDVLIELIENDFDLATIEYMDVDVQKAYNYYLTNSNTLP